MRLGPRWIRSVSDVGAMPERIRITLTPREVFALVRRLPVEVVERLADGPQDGDGRCGVCAALRGHATAPVHDTPANRLQTWHEDCVLHDPGRGYRQDPVRCGVIYGAAAALCVRRETFLRQETVLERRLRRSLEKWGRHKEGCPAATFEGAMRSRCICGFHEALADFAQGKADGHAEMDLS